MTPVLAESNVRLSAAVEVAELLAARVRERDAQIRTSFVEQRDPSGGAPPLARLLRGGRGGEVRLKLLLSLLWVAARPPHDVSLSTRVWAELLGLADPATKGARRISAAMHWLALHEFVQRQDQPGRPPRLVLLEEAGNGREYTLPGARIAELAAADEDWSAHRYVKLPKELWTSGWLAALSGPALTMLLVLLAHGSVNHRDDLWFSPGFADQRYHVSEDTRYRGLADLKGHGLVAVRKRPLRRSRLEEVRLRNSYSLDLERLNRPAEWVSGPRRSIASSQLAEVAPSPTRLRG